MKRILFLLLAACCLPALLTAQEDPAFLGYRDTVSLLPVPPGSLAGGLGGYINPALPAAGEPGLLLALSTPPREWSEVDRAGVFGALGGPSLGLLTFRDPAGEQRLNLRAGLAAGNGELAFGLANETAFLPGGRTESFHACTAGLLFRPGPRFSLGLHGTAVYGGGPWEAALDAGLRPFGTSLLTLFGDYSLCNDEEPGDGVWALGLAAQPTAGLTLAAGVSSEGTFALGLELGLSGASAWSRLGFGEDGRTEAGAWGLRFGPPRPSLTDRGEPPAYLKINLLGPLVYREEFLGESHGLLGVLEMIREAGTDPRIAGIALNVSGLAAGREALYELREALTAFRATGRRLVVYLDAGGEDLYYLASAADRVVLDPNGLLFLTGYRSGRIYLKGTLDKLGIGYEEWRLYTYKSAGETFSRDKMSDADREQYQAYVDDIAGLVKRELTAARGLSAEELEQILAELFVLNADEALEAGLIDEAGCWEEVEDLVADLEGRRKRFITYGRGYRRGGWDPGELLAAGHGYRAPRPDAWGEPPTVAVVYALGAMDLDGGMNARRLSAVLRSLADDGDVKAVVLRVDSPGGSLVAADLVAEALRRVRERKPVIVSQGSMAASGGYWVSMPADLIVASPFTLTGSIGVIGGWFYDRGFNAKLGFGTDLVQSGLHADLGFGFLLPDRNLTAAERQRMDVQLAAIYERFSAGVAESRGLSAERVEELAQGRVWSGIAARNAGLVDELGGLERALELARQRAGLEPGAPVRLLEVPRGPLFALPGLLRLAPGPPPAGRAVDAALESLGYRLRHNGEPLLLLPLDIPLEENPGRGGAAR